MRSVTLLAALFLAALSAVAAPPSILGHVTPSSYVNDHFHFAYDWPKILSPIDNATLNVPPPTANQFVLFSAQQKNTVYGVIIMALRQTPSPGYAGFKNGNDLLSQMLTHFHPENHMTVSQRMTVTSPSGLKFDEVDYQANGQFCSGMATQIGDFLIVFRINAGSASDLSILTKSALATRKLN